MALYDIPNGERGTKFVLSKMSELAHNAMRDSDLIEFTSSLIKDLPERNQYAEAKRIFEFVRDDVRYVKDPQNLETVFSPQNILGLKKDADVWYTTGRMQGDCDDKCSLLAAMLQSIGIPTRFVAIKTPTHPSQYTHVYLELNVDNRWIPADSITKHGLGWSYPLALQKIYFDNTIGKIYKEAVALAGLGEPIKILDGVNKLIEGIKDVQIANTGNIKQEIGKWFSSPVALVAIIALLVYGFKRMVSVKRR